MRFDSLYLYGEMQLIIYKEQTYKTTRIPHHLLYSNSEKTLHNFQTTLFGHQMSLSSSFSVLLPHIAPNTFDDK